MRDWPTLSHAAFSALNRSGKTLLIALLLSTTLLARTALAWRQYTTTEGLPMHWPASASPKLAYGIDVTGLSQDGLAPVAVAAAIDASFGTWQAVACPVCTTDAATVPCTAANACVVRSVGLGFADLGPQNPQAIGLGCQATSASACVPAPDGNQILFIHNSDAWPFGSQIIAMTVVTATADAGEIVDADVALNAGGVAFCLDECGPGKIHLGAVIQHEAGHFLGLDHSEQPDAVMFARPPAQTVAMASLTADDIAGVCAAYPAVPSPVACPVQEDGGAPSHVAAGCRAVPAPASPTCPALLAIAIAVGLARRSRTS